MLNRREILKIVAGLPLVSCAYPLVASEAHEHRAAIPPLPLESYGSEIVVNIFLHGMFAIVFGDSGVTLMPPHVEGKTPHVYLASDLKDSPAKFIWLTRGADYPLALPGADQPPEISERTNVKVTLTDKVHPDPTHAPHCTIRLPFPHGFTPLHSVISLCDGEPLFTQSGSLVKSPDSIPLVTMLTYRLGPSSIGDISFKYHLFAEPEICPRDFHSSEALAELKKCFTNLNSLEFNQILGPDNLLVLPDSADPNDELALVQIEGVSQCRDDNPISCPPSKFRQKSLAIRPHDGPGGRFGVHPTACMSVVFTQP